MSTTVESTQLPLATVTAGPTARRSKWWILAVISLFSSIGLFWYANRSAGLVIVLEFQEGHGIKPEDRLRHHGIDVGEVTRVELTGDLERVEVSVRLHPNASNLAVEGSQFWIVRPSFSIDQVSGLETILGAKYLSVKPGAKGSKRATRFVGLEAPPIGTVKEGSLEIFIDGAARGGLSNGAPILFRGYRIGNIVQVGLATDARSVRARCAIDPEYRDLVRKNSRFWNRSGWRLDVGFSGIKIDADSLAQILSGGIEMATPEEPEPAVNMGHAFVLHEKAREEWTSWQPSMGHGARWQELEGKRPVPLRIALRWQEKSFMSFRLNKQRAGWCLPLDDGTILCLKEQIIAPKDAIPETISLEYAGMAMQPHEVEMVGAVDEASKMVRFRPPTKLPDEIAKWSSKGLKRTGAPTDLVVAHGDTGNSLAIDSKRIGMNNNGDWTLDSPQLMNDDIHGLPVVEAESNKVIGLTSKQDRKVILVVLPQGLP